MENLDISLCGEVAESWQSEHKEAMQAIDVDEAVARGLALFNIIRENATLLYKRGPSDPAVHQMIRGGFEWWLRPVKDLLATIDEQKRLGYNIEREEEFRKACHYALGATIDWSKKTTGGMSIDEHRSKRRGCGI